MKRGDEIQECKDIIFVESPDHLHIRRKAIVTGFVSDLQANLKDAQIVSIDISDWERTELMETLRNELQKELSWFKFYLSHIKNVGGSLFGFGASAGVETRPDYDRVNKYLDQVANKADSQVLIFINYHGPKPVDQFSWFAKFDIPNKITIVTNGYTACGLENAVQYDIGRLEPSQTNQYLNRLGFEGDENEALKIHRIHDGNPVALEIASENDSLTEPLEDEQLDQLWDSVYQGKITPEEYNLLTDSSHLIDLDRRAVTEVTEMRRGHVKDILDNLKSKGIVSEEGSGLFTTDKYVKLYMSRELSDEELSEQHRMSFGDHAERWMAGHESRMEKMRNGSEEEEGESVSAPDFDSGLTDPNLFLAMHHLSKIHPDITKQEFIQELQELDSDESNVFGFGMVAQRFFFEEPIDVLQALSESILGIDEDIENELFSGTLGAFFDFDSQEYLSELSKGWSSQSIDTNDLNINVSKPDNIVKKIGDMFDSDLYQSFPPEVKRAIAHFAAVPLVNSRKAREYYKMFGKTATNYGFDEKPYLKWLEEVENLADQLTPAVESVSDEDEQDVFEDKFEALDNEIRNRMQLEEFLKANHSQSQKEFQQRLDSIRNRPDEISEQFIRCGEELEKMENCVFAYLWYTFGHEIFSQVVLGQQDWKIYGEYNRLSGKREQYEASYPDDELVITKDMIETRIS